MTLLVFKKSPLDKSKLVAPDKTVIESATADGKFVGLPLLATI